MTVKIGFVKYCYDFGKTIILEHDIGMIQKLMLILFSMLSPGIVDDDNLIDWTSTRKLNWTDFRGRPDPGSPNAALTSSSINVEFGYNQSGLIHSIKCRFNKSLSWVRIRNNYILNHEQGHFDIAEWHARVLHRQLKDYEFNSKTVGRDINIIYDRVMKDHVQSQQQYDEQTNHSLDTAMQRQWDVKIAGMLKDNQPFADYATEGEKLKQSIQR
jgi:Bacterial protein of unknown function (DUF922)